MAILPHWTDVEATEDGLFAGCRCGWRAGPFLKHNVATGMARRHRDETQTW